MALKGNEICIRIKRKPAGVPAIDADFAAFAAGPGSIIGGYLATGCPPAPSRNGPWLIGAVLAMPVGCWPAAAPAWRWRDGLPPLSTA